MFKKGNKLYSIIEFKCPKCHEGDLYPTSLTSFSKIFTMNDHCDHCGQAFDLEPGFYWGAMYVAYALSSGFLLVAYALIYFLLGTSLITTFFIVFAIIFAFYGLIFRLSRAIWINIYVSYDPRADKQPELYKSEMK